MFISDVLVFDNSSSWVHGKELTYVVEIVSMTYLETTQDGDSRDEEAASNGVR